MLVFLIFSYWFSIYFLGGLTSDHILLCSFAGLCFYWNESTRKFIRFVAPIILSGIIYDSMRYYADYIRGPVHVAEPYLLEKTLFGFGANTMTPNEYLQIHTHPLLDFFCGLAYLIFIFEYFFVCIYLYFTKHWKYLRIAAWSFFLVNLLGYITYYVYAAAPPWYVAMHGFGPAKLDTLPNPAGAARFDALLGTSFFTGMYSKSSDVFGALPSLHVSYPFIAAVLAFKIKRFRIPAVLFFLLMCFSAVYLNHHYLIDVLLGIIYAVVTLMIVGNIYKNRAINFEKII